MMIGLVAFFLLAIFIIMLYMGGPSSSLGLLVFFGADAPCMPIVRCILFSLLPYLIGAIPTGYLFAKYGFGIDITQQGSGNIGATNIGRVLGSPKYFLLIFFLDAAKAFGLLYIGQYMFCMPFFMVMYWAMILLIGNAYSCFLQFKGGKGVATFVGCLIALAPISFIISLVSMWFLFFVYFRRTDMPSLLSLSLALPLYGAFFYAKNADFFYFLLFACIFIFVRHTSNLKTWLAS